MSADLERLGEESLDLSGPGDLKFVLLGQLVHTQDSDDVLEGLVVLKDLLNTASNSVVFVSDDVRVHDTGCGVKGIYSGVDSSFSNRSQQ